MTAGKGRALTWIENNLLAILMALAGVIAGYVTGMTTTDNRLAALEQRAGNVDDTLEDLKRGQDGIIRNLDRINDRLGISPPQPLETAK